MPKKIIESKNSLFNFFKKIDHLIYKIGDKIL